MPPSLNRCDSSCEWQSRIPKLPSPPENVNVSPSAEKRTDKICREANRALQGIGFLVGMARPEIRPSAWPTYNSWLFGRNAKDSSGGDWKLQIFFPLPGEITTIFPFVFPPASIDQSEAHETQT